MENNNAYLPVSECARISGISAKRIRRLCREKKLDHRKDSKSYFVNLPELLNFVDEEKRFSTYHRFRGNQELAFGDLELEHDTVFKPILSVNKVDELFDSEKFELRYQYWVSNDGRVYSADEGIFLKPFKCGGRLHVRLVRRDGKPLDVAVHRLVAYYFCRGWMTWTKEITHHIDLNPINNSAENLLWVTKKEHLYYEPAAKTSASIRSFPMSSSAVNYLFSLKAEQDERKKRPGYNHQWDDFVCVRNNGDLIPLEYVSRYFPKLCEKAGLRRLKLHELRHTNISLLLESGASMKELQEWAGHSSYSTTANIYSHVQAKTKSKMTESLEKIIC